MDKRKFNGGKREGSGRKDKKRFVDMTVMLPPDDKEKIKQKYGRSFNEIFRAWIKTLIG